MHPCRGLMGTSCHDDIYSVVRRLNFMLSGKNNRLERQSCNWQRSHFGRIQTSLFRSGISQFSEARYTKILKVSLQITKMINFTIGMVKPCCNVFAYQSEQSFFPSAFKKYCMWVVHFPIAFNKHLFGDQKTNIHGVPLKGNLLSLS